MRDFFTGSFLEEAPVIPVSSLTGDGIDQVVDYLDQVIGSLTFQEEFGPFRMAVDRVFSMKGFGTVITGTSLSGRIAGGDDIMFYPGGLKAKIRSIQVHGREVDLIEAGHRTAINLQGVEKDQINRGDMAATPGCMTPSTLLDARLHYLASAEKELKNRTQVRVHVGTREITGRILLMEEDRLSPGDDADIQLILQEPVAVWPGDHYVVRSYSPITTIGGGAILNSAPRKRKRATEKDRARNREVFTIYHSGSEAEKMLLFLEESGLEGITLEQMAVRLGIFGKRLKKFLQAPISSGQVMVVESDSQRMLAAGTCEQLKEAIRQYLAAYHADNPLKSGVAAEEIRSRLKPPMDSKLFQFLLSAMVRKEEIEQTGAEVRLAGHTVTLQVDEEEMQEKIAALYRQAGLKPPNLKDVLGQFAQFPEAQIIQVITLLIKRGTLVKVNESLYFAGSTLEKLAQDVEAYIRDEGEIDAPRFKELTGLTRKFSIPLLEYFDKIKLTIRIGDRRVLRKTQAS